MISKIVPGIRTDCPRPPGNEFDTSQWPVSHSGKTVRRQTLGYVPQ